MGQYKLQSRGADRVKGSLRRRSISVLTVVLHDVCPAQIDMDSMFLEARKRLHRMGRMPWAYHDFWLRDMEFADGKWASIVRTPPGVDKSEYAFFPGCQMGASEPRYVSETYRWLLSKDPTMALFLKCCGTPVKWAGDEEKHAETIYKLRKVGELGSQACGCCPRINNICEFLPEAELISLYEFMEVQAG